MSGIETFMSIFKVEGEVMLHDGNSGWLRAHDGMTFRAGDQITIKTGSTGRVQILSVRGELVNLPANTMKVITATFSADDVDTLRQFKLSARDMMAACVHRRLAPAV